MSLQDKVMKAMKAAMKEKNQTALAALRAVKSEILLAQTASDSTDGLTEEKEIKILSKLVKQRKDSAAIFSKQNREDLVKPELDQAEVISQFLPEQLSESEIIEVVIKAIADTDAQGMKDMGKIMGIVSKQLTGKADGKTISAIVKANLIKKNL